MEDGNRPEALKENNVQLLVNQSAQLSATDASNIINIHNSTPLHLASFLYSLEEAFLDLTQLNLKLRLCLKKI